uniref:Uncharacterized protein n=1 Tax=Amphimedon queenslandica TaxID=400682 RepID=A0A1X7VS73_AMPQE
MIFLSYVTILVSDPRLRELVPCGQTVIQLAWSYGDPGLLEYDSLFQQQVAYCVPIHLTDVVYILVLPALKEGIQQSIVKKGKGRPKQVTFLCSLASGSYLWFLSHYPYMSDQLAQRQGDFCQFQRGLLQISATLSSSAELPTSLAELLTCLARGYMAAELGEATVRVAGPDEAIHVNQLG